MLLLAAPASCANRDALRQIVQEQCVAHWLAEHSPAPCQELHFAHAADVDSGYALLADRKGGAHFLLIPTRTISGIEGAALLMPDSPNYFAAAWRARSRLAIVAGHDIPRSAVGLAVNPMHARGQDQLHIHIECLRPDVMQALDSNAGRLNGSWAPITLDGSSYAALEIPGEDLEAVDPFKLLAHRMPQEGRLMGDYTLVVAGMQSKSGPGFFVLASTTAAGELLLDSSCAAARRADEARGP